MQTAKTFPSWKNTRVIRLSKKAMEFLLDEQMDSESLAETLDRVLTKKGAIENEKENVRSKRTKRKN